MGRLLERLQDGATSCVWIESSDYAGALFGGGAVPWNDAAAAIALLRKAQSLVRSDVAALPLAAIADRWLAAHPALLQAMGAKDRAWYPVRTLLADGAMRSHLAELAGSLRAVFAAMPLALILPAPKAWTRYACLAAFGPQAPAVDNDDAERAAVYVADFLRIFGELGVDVLLLEALEAGDLQEEAVRPVLNVAEHYRWDAGVRWAGALVGEPDPAGLAFRVAVDAGAGVTGIELPAQFWSNGAPLPLRGSHFQYAAIPAQANPERVLERIAALRGTAGVVRDV
jgi:hypothetical protein